MAHMVVDDNDPRTDQEKEEDLIDENWEPEVFLRKYKIGSPKPKMVPPPKEREPGYLAHRKSVADFAAKKRAEFVEGSSKDADVEMTLEEEEALYYAEAEYDHEDEDATYSS